MLWFKPKKDKKKRSALKPRRIWVKNPQSKPLNFSDWHRWGCLGVRVGVPVPTQPAHPIVLSPNFLTCEMETIPRPSRGLVRVRHGAPWGWGLSCHFLSPAWACPPPAPAVPSLPSCWADSFVFNLSPPTQGRGPPGGRGPRIPPPLLPGWPGRRQEKPDVSQMLQTLSKTTAQPDWW